MELDNLMRGECKVKRTVAKEKTSTNINIEKSFGMKSIKGKKQRWEKAQKSMFFLNIS